MDGVPPVRRSVSLRRTGAASAKSRRDDTLLTVGVTYGNRAASVRRSETLRRTGAASAKSRRDDTLLTVGGA
ncbi:MAG: hypothetical protein LBR10_01375 [Prevotellaceae bacterium]|nr:hypothetical protein [Prevotellaceae bacterium]